MQHLTPNEIAAVQQFARALRSTLGRNLISATFFGSKVRGDYRNDSDIDVLIIVNEQTTEQERIISHEWAKVELEHDASISYVVYSEHEWAVNKKLGSPFALNVEREGVTI